MNKDITIENALAAIVRLLEGAHADWVLGGSAGLMLRGLPLQDKPMILTCMPTMKIMISSTSG